MFGAPRALVVRRFSKSTDLIFFYLIDLISLGLALSPPSTSVSSDFMVLCKCLKNYTYFTLPWSGKIGPLSGGLTNCCPSVLDTVG